jgi:hypothetical protein
MLRTGGDARRPWSVVSVIDAVCPPTRSYAACEDERQGPKLQRQGWTALSPVDTRARTPLRSVKSAACIPCRRRSAYELSGVRRERPASVPEPAPIRAQWHHPDRQCQGPCPARTSRTWNGDAASIEVLKGLSGRSAPPTPTDLLLAADDGRAAAGRPSRPRPRASRRGASGRTSGWWRSAHTAHQFGGPCRLEHRGKWPLTR